MLVASVPLVPASERTLHKVADRREGIQGSAGGYKRGIVLNGKDIP
jgi:hypothetical protein